ncbi:iron ABC transporter permease [Microbacterium protaetiae]|uniref:Iron ABC transporter permease n=1 Tax=Microbacterium protaetiae TaxID=2509458 RepID=A0A4P6EIG5_9MICO|nr:iron ABC transporter permease [Microbacterium protaetiae]
MALVLTVLSLALVAGVALTAGTITVAPDRVVAALFGFGDKVETLIVGRRAVRLCAGLLVGFALGASGGLTQSLTRNPLASPDILGITTGAGVFAVLAIVTPVAGFAAAALVPVAALFGGLATAAVVVGLAWRSGLEPLRLVLVGVGLTAICGAITQWLLMRSDVEWAAVATRWLAGSLASSSWSDVRLLLPVCVLGAVAIAAVARPLGALRLGSDLARSLGTGTGPTQLGILVLAVVLVSMSTAVAGPVGFVAFVAPQIAMRVFHTAGPPAFASGLCGALLVTAADLTTRWLPVELPVGILTSLVGGPVLLVLLFRYVRRTSS